MTVPVYTLTLHKTYYAKGFFNLGVDVERYVRKDSGTAVLFLGNSKTRIEASVDRNANQNGTPRILGGAELRNWLQRNCKLGDRVNIHILKPAELWLLPVSRSAELSVNSPRCQPPNNRLQRTEVDNVPRHEVQRAAAEPGRLDVIRTAVPSTTFEQLALNGDSFSVSVDGVQLLFQRVTLSFLGDGLAHVFGQKNNKTVAETLSHKRYAKFSAMIARDHPDSLKKPLGDFLLGLKRKGSTSYKQFLNPYGDATYCRFRMERGPLSSKKGLYCYGLAGRLVYIGRSFDPFEKRVNQGYGSIHPKNCFLDGQATNCHLNALIAKNMPVVSFFVCPLDDDPTISQLERKLIQLCQPHWNIALKHGQNV